MAMMLRWGSKKSRSKRRAVKSGINSSDAAVGTRHQSKGGPTAVREQNSETRNADDEMVARGDEKAANDWGAAEAVATAIGSCRGTPGITAWRDDARGHQGIIDWASDLEESLQTHIGHRQSQRSQVGGFSASLDEGPLAPDTEAGAAAAGNGSSPWRQQYSKKSDPRLMSQQDDGRGTDDAAAVAPTAALRQGGSSLLPGVMRDVAASRGSGGLFPEEPIQQEAPPPAPPPSPIDLVSDDGCCDDDDDSDVMIIEPKEPGDAVAEVARGAPIASGKATADPVAEDEAEDTPSGDDDAAMLSACQQPLRLRPRWPPPHSASAAAAVAAAEAAAASAAQTAVPAHQQQQQQQRSPVPPRPLSLRHGASSAVVPEAAAAASRDDGASVGVVIDSGSNHDAPGSPEVGRGQKTRRKRSTAEAIGDRAWSPKYLGVFWSQQERSWRAEVAHEQQTWTLGPFANAREAAMAYDVETVKRKGSSVSLNFLGENGSLSGHRATAHKPSAAATTAGGLRCKKRAAAQALEDDDTTDEEKEDRDDFRGEKEVLQKRRVRHRPRDVRGKGLRSPRTKQSLSWKRIGETLLSGRPEGAAGGNCRSPAAMQRPSPLPPRPQRERAADSGRPQQHAPDDIPPLTSMRGLGASSLFDRTAVGNYDCAASETKEEATTRGSKRRRRSGNADQPPPETEAASSGSGGTVTYDWASRTFTVRFCHGEAVCTQQGFQTRNEALQWIDAVGKILRRLSSSSVHHPGEEANQEQLRAGAAPTTSTAGPLLLHSSAAATDRPPASLFRSSHPGPSPLAAAILHQPRHYGSSIASQRRTKHNRRSSHPVSKQPRLLHAKKQAGGAAAIIMHRDDDLQKQDIMANGEEQHDGSMTACGHHAAFPDVSPVAPPPPSLVPLSPSSRDPGQVTASPEKHPQAQTPQAALPGAPQQQTSPGYTCRIEMADGHGTVVHSQEFGDAGQAEEEFCRLSEERHGDQVLRLSDRSHETMLQKQSGNILLEPGAWMVRLAGCSGETLLSREFTGSDEDANAAQARELFGGMTERMSPGEVLLTFGNGEVTSYRPLEGLDDGAPSPSEPVDGTLRGTRAHGDSRAPPPPGDRQGGLLEDAESARDEAARDAGGLTIAGAEGQHSGLGVPEKLDGRVVGRRFKMLRNSTDPLAWKAGTVRRFSSRTGCHLVEFDGPKRGMAWVFLEAQTLEWLSENTAAIQAPE